MLGDIKIREIENKTIRQDVPDYQDIYFKEGRSHMLQLLTHSIASNRSKNIMEQT